MVIVHRRQSATNYDYAENSFNSNISVGIGGEGATFRSSSASSSSYLPPSSVYTTHTPSVSYNSQISYDTNYLQQYKKGQGTSRWALLLIYSVAVVTSWTLASRTTEHEKTMLAVLEKKVKIPATHVQRIIDDIRKLRYQTLATKKRTKELQEVRRLLDQEINGSKIDESKSNKTKRNAVSRNQSFKATQKIKKWIDSRHQMLSDKIYNLQYHLQESSRRAVIEKYGKGPHKVKFTFEHNNSKTSGKVDTGSFIVELAPIDDMPMSVHFFLELVSNKFWDSTFFIHHEKVEHVIIVPPISYKTRKTKKDEIHEIGWPKLGFPEYSHDYPHVKYTLGFANQGPTFYFNTMDNTYNHGPDGQNHHLLSGEADPCFGWVVEGFDAIDEMIEYGLKQGETKKVGEEQLKPIEDETSWTHLLNAEILSLA